ncbi:MAG: hypothetical protein ACYTEQ_30155 [Planctomycetota bacterium]|jgi:hypothetical protein
MNKFASVILALCLLVGCESSQTGSESEYDRISREIEQLKAESQGAGSLGENIRIVVNMLATSVTDRFAIDSLWRYVDENVAIVKRPETFTRSGLRIGVGDEHFRARLDITKRRLRSSEETEFLCRGFTIGGYGTTPLATDSGGRGGL